MVTVLNDLLRHRERCLLALRSPCTYRSKLHKQAYLPIRCICRHYDLLPKRSALPSDACYTQHTFQTGLRFSYAPICRSGHLWRTGYLNKCQQSSPLDNIWQHLLLTTFPSDYWLCSQNHNFSCVSLLHYEELYMKLLQRAVFGYYHNCHQYNKCNAYLYSQSQILSNLDEFYFGRTSSFQYPSFSLTNTYIYYQIYACLIYMYIWQMPSNFWLSYILPDYRMPISNFGMSTIIHQVALVLPKNILQFHLYRMNQTHFCLVYQRTSHKGIYRIFYQRYTQLSVAKMRVQYHLWFSNSFLLSHHIVCAYFLVYILSRNYETYNNFQTLRKLVLNCCFFSYARILLYKLINFKLNNIYIIYNYYLNNILTYNIIINYNKKNKYIYGFECFGTSRNSPYPKQTLKSTEGRGVVLQVYPLGIDPITRTQSNILELGWAGLSWNITLSTAPTILRSLRLASPTLRQEADGDFGLLLLLNFWHNTMPLQSLTTIGLQGHIYMSCRSLHISLMSLLSIRGIRKRCKDTTILRTDKIRGFTF